MEASLAYPKGHDRDLAADLAFRVNALPNQCYENSLRAARSLGLNGSLEVFYVEGWLSILGGILIEHGWLEVEGRLVDVTLDDEEPGDYYPVVRWSLQRLQEEAMMTCFFQLPLYMTKLTYKRVMASKQWAIYGLTWPA